MKRREFIRSSAALAGTTVMPLAFGQSKLCPPSSMTIGGRVVTTPCLAIPPAAWSARSTAPGVLWAHDFSASANELNYFWRYYPKNWTGDQSLTNPSPAVLATLQNPLSLTASGLGSSQAIVSRIVGANVTGYWNGSSLASTIPAASAGASQTWALSSAADFPNPATIGNYDIFVGTVQPAPDGTTVVEQVTVTAIDYPNNRITLARGSEGTPAAAYTLSSTFRVNVGMPPQGSWNRPFGCFPAGQNGLTKNDPANGAAVPLRTWSTQTDTTTHNNWREGYYGSPYYWNPQTVPSPPYQNWTPTDQPGSTRQNCFDGQEIWIQFRAKVSASRLQVGADQAMYAAAGHGKMLFVQNSFGPGVQQMFWTVGPVKGKELPVQNEQGLGADAFGTYLAALTCYGDSRAPAGGSLLAGGNQSGGPTSGVTQMDDDFPSSVFSTASPFNAWCYPGDVWVTYLLHFVYGMDNSPRTAPYTEPSPPWPSGSQYLTTFELYVAMPGAAEYTKILDATKGAANWRWFFGDSGAYGQYLYNPPGVNMLWLLENPNMYVGGGSVSPPDHTTYVYYTQVIASRSYIPVPLDAA